MRTENKIGIMYFFIHIIIEITCYYIMSLYDKSNIIIVLAFAYDFAAFVPEGLYGAIKDFGIKINFTIVGLFLSSAALTLFNFNVYPLIVVLVLTLGNGMIHLEGAEATLRNSKGKIFPSALFVAGGTFGVITGKILGTYEVSWIIVLGINLLTVIPLYLSRRYIASVDKETHNNRPTESAYRFQFAKKSLGVAVVVISATFVVIVRSYMGFIIPVNWNDALYKNILLFCFMGIGKALGGFLVDHIGIRKTIFISTLGALPFIILGNWNMYCSLFGIMLFSMTMSIALGLLVSVMNNFPGVAFGFTTLGIFLGLISAYIFHFESFAVNCIVLSLLSVFCFIILFSISTKNVNN